ncbi:hypothetical protein GCM10027035_46800 [Emticicia sediminis]
MELQIKPFHKNIFPLNGLFIRGENVSDWISEMQQMQLNLKEIEVYAIPNVKANSIWGCLIVINDTNKLKHISRNELAQLANGLVYMPEKTVLFPNLTVNETAKLFKNQKHIFHPEIGLFELEEALDFLELLEKPILKQVEIESPKDTIFIPKHVNSLRVQPISPEEILQSLENNTFPQKEEFEDRPLSILEKGKLLLYKAIFNSSKNEEGKFDAVINQLFSPLISILPKSIGNLVDKMQNNFEKLEKRNQNEVEKLLDLLKNNPKEALKYAIPLDNDGTSRGGFDAQFNLSKLWSDFSLFGNSRLGNGGGSANLGDQYFTLQQQYRKTAEELIKQKEYQKAAFVYMKLLKNYHQAAQTLEDGQMYQEAATVHLKYTKNKQKAAECYEKGKMILEAIEIYAELNQKEKVGDLYVSINKKKEADVYYEMVINDYRTNGQFIKASLISKNKVRNIASAQELLLEGWHSKRDAVNCLTNYFSNIENLKELKNEINRIYSEDLDGTNQTLFLETIKHEFKKQHDFADDIRNIAYEIIAKEIKTNPSISIELKEFNKEDKVLIKDALRYRTTSKNR